MAPGNAVHFYLVLDFELDFETKVVLNLLKKSFQIRAN